MAIGLSEAGRTQPPTGPGSDGGLNTDSVSSSAQATVLMSGGIDSAACAHLFVSQGFMVRGVFIDYGQAGARLERRAVRALSSCLRVPLTIYEVHPAGPYSAGELVGRNAFLIFASLLLTCQRSGLLAIGVHAGSPYYDCSPPFIQSVADLVAEYTDGAVEVVAPFVDWSKRDIFQYFVSAGLSVGLTYSCEAGTEPPCGECASCRDRLALEC